MKGKDKISSVEVLSAMLKQSTLSKKERERLKKQLEEEEDGGKGTIWLKNEEKYEKAAEECEGDLLSPGGRANAFKSPAHKGFYSDSHYPSQPSVFFLWPLS